MIRPAVRSLLSALVLASAGPALCAPDATPGGAGGWALAAQDSPRRDADEEALRGLVADIARSWARGDAGGVLSRASEQGVRLQLAGGGSSPQSHRRAEAALRRLLEDADGGRASAGMVSVVGGSPTRGFGELLWESGAGMPGLVRTVVYLGFEMEDGRWRLSEIRLL
ncbi:MAG TPA: hypothetical protein VML95_10975 [Longimicrobiales bacterium]|nr:hypothetical protein [Longimicrobiales bacterium]